MHIAGNAATAILHFTSCAVDAYSRALVSYVTFLRPDLLNVLKATLNELYDRLGMDEGQQRDFLA